MVNIGLGNVLVSACAAGDGDGSGEITVDEIVTAIGAALAGCGLEGTGPMLSYLR
jgi:hypothetical protein